MATVELLTTGDVPAVLLRKIRALLRDAFDGGFSEDEREHALGGWYAIVTEGGQPIAHAAVTPRVSRSGGARSAAATSKLSELIRWASGGQQPWPPDHG